MINNNSILLFTKDALCTEYLPCYGNKYWEGKTPNLDEMVKKGTLFTRFYTAAPSSAMAYMSMFTGKYPYQHEIMEYVPILKPYSGLTLFDKAREKGYECHIIWDEKWMTTSYLHSMCYGEGTIIHPLKDLRQGVGFHNQHEGELMPSKEKEEATLDMIEKEISIITSKGNRTFVWFHLPHVINGRTGYGTDIDLHDRVLGVMRKYFNDDKIFISADHGNMNGHKGKIGYGFDVYEPAVRIPLITPKKQNYTVYDGLTCNIDLDKIIFDGDEIPEREIIISDTAYYAQPRRKTVFIYNNYRYIYNRYDKSEELYDIDWDQEQQFNLINDEVFDIDRHVFVKSRELFFYPYWNKLSQVRQKLRDEKMKIWREPSKRQKLFSWVKKNRFVRRLGLPFLNFFLPKSK